MPPAYKPIVTARADALRATALVGTHSIALAWNYPKNQRPKKLMGFAVRRSEFLPGDDVADTVTWLNGQKRFAQDGADIDAELPLDQAPLQRFRWSDYTLEPGRRYRYEIFPMIGEPGQLTRLNAAKIDAAPSPENDGTIGVYANRGVTAAMAYLRRFGGEKPQDVANGAAFDWLARELKSALLDFIDGAQKGEALHVCIYEFFDEEIAKRLKAAKDAGVDVQIVYHAKPNDHATHENESMLRKVGLKSSATAREEVGKISHNKFVVHLTKKGNPKRLWTGSANFSENAFHYQTNVAMVFEDNGIARAYEDYFQLLAADVGRGRKSALSNFVQDRVEAIHDGLAANPVGNGSEILFSPVRREHVVEAACDLIRDAKSALFLSAPFGIGKEILDAIDANTSDILEYGLANTTARKKIEGLNHTNTRFFTPTRLKTYMGRSWDAKAFGAHKIHAKSLVIDPWSANPKILIGSANFSKPSCRDNDENTFLVEGDARFAAIVTTEFLRMYDHYKSRYWINRMKDEGRAQEIFLDESPKWSDIYYKKTTKSHKLRDREVFAGLA